MALQDGMSQKLKDWAREADTRWDWQSAFLFLILFSIVGIFLTFQQILNYELMYQVDTHSKGTVTLVLIFIVITEVIGCILKRSDLRDKTNALDRWRIDVVYPPGFTELVTDDEDETADNYDPVLLEEAKWFGVKEIAEINMDPEMVEKIVISGKIDWDAFKENWPTIKAFMTGEPSDRTGYHFCIVRFDKFLRFKIKHPATTHKTKEIIVAFPVPVREALKLRRMKVPAGGFSVNHSHAERVKLVYKRIVSGDLPVYKLNDSAYFDNVDKEAEPDDPTAFAAGLVETLAYQYKRLELRVQGDLQALQNVKAEKDEDKDIEKKQMIDLVKSFNIQKDKDAIDFRMHPKREEAPVFWFLTAIGWGLFVFVLVGRMLNLF